MRKQLRKLLLWIGAVVAVLFATSVLVIGTEPGSRWVLDKVTGKVTGLDIEAISGTLLTDLEIGRAGYETPKFTITITQLKIDFSWSRSSLRQLTMQNITASEVRYRNLAAAGREPKPLAIPVPNLPIALLVDNVSVQSVFIDEKIINGATARMLGLGDDGLRAATAEASFAGVDSRVSDFVVQFDDDLSIDSNLEWQYLNNEWSGKASVDGSLRQLLFQHELLSPHAATAVGSVSLLQQTEPLFDAVVRFADWQDDMWTVAAGELVFQGTMNDYRATVAAKVTNENLFSADVEVTGSGNTEGLQDVDVRAQSPLGLILAVGDITWSPEPLLQLQITGEGIDLADFLPVAPGKLATEFSLQASNPRNFAVDVTSLSGTYNDQPIRAHGAFSVVDTAYLCTACELLVGQNNIAIDGSLDGRNLAATFSVDAASLEQLWPALGGSITANGTMRGSVALPTLTVSASGELVSWHDWQAGSFTIESRMPEADNIYLQLDIDGLSQGDIDFGSGQMLAEGTRSAVDVSTDWTRGEVSASAQGMITLADEAIVGTVSRANLTEPYSGNWKLVRPMEFSSRAGELQVAANSWVNGDADLHNEPLVIAAGDIQAGTTLSNIPLEIANSVLPENIRLSGFADVEISVHREGESWTGDLRWKQNDTEVWLSQQGSDEFQIAVPVVEIDAHLDAAGATARAAIEVEPGLNGLLEVSVDELSPDTELRARLQFSGDEWDWIPVFLPEVDAVQGTISADISAEGRLESPQLQGGLRWQQGQLAMPALNAPLTDIDITVTATSVDDVKIAGDAVAGGGSLRLDGRLDNIASSNRSFSVGVKGDNAVLLNWPDYQVTASPELQISGNATAVEVTGKLKVDRADIIVNELPEGAVRPSADVIVSGESAEIRSKFLLTGDVATELSENVHIVAFGLDSGLEGNLRISQRVTGNPRANGELRLINGLFGAYGQQLEIERGTLTFTGPIDDPIVNVRAVREIETLSGTVTVGVELGGRAKNPSSTLFSSPAMPETDTLSYLVIGRSLQDASTADGNAVANAAFALGVRQAALITHQIGQSLGLDELAIEGSNQSTISLVAGKQLNSRFYARYGYGVFARIGNLLLRYQLNDRFTIEVGAGDSQSMDLLYIIEKQ